MTTAISPTRTFCRSSSAKTMWTGSPKICLSFPTRSARASSNPSAFRLYDADVLVAEREAADYFETAVKGREPKQAANWVINELFGRLNKEGKSIGDSPVSADRLGAMLDLIKDGTISGKIAKDVFDIMFTEGGDPRAIVEARGLTQVTDMGAIEQAVVAVIAANPDKAEQAKAKPALAGWFVGQVMKATGGKASPQSVNELVKAKLGIE